jgi:hypothetical protein
LFENAVKNNDVVITKNKSKFLKTFCASGQKNAIEEMFKNNDVSMQLKDVKAADEVIFYIYVYISFFLNNF